MACALCTISTEKKEEGKNIEGPLRRLSYLSGVSHRNIPPPPTPPGKAPEHYRQADARGTAPGPGREAVATPVTLPVQRGSVAAVLDAVDNAPQGGTWGGHDGHDAPVGGKVLDAPDHADDDGDEAKGGAVAEADEGGGAEEGGRVVRDEEGEGGGEGEEADAQKGCTGN